jgi:hypothetical protein
VNLEGVVAFIHENAPHTDVALYSASAISAVFAVSMVYLRCLWTKSTEQLEPSWLVRVAAWAAPIPVYAALIALPFDPDLTKVLIADQFIVALAGLYGIVESTKDVRRVAGRAYEERLKSRPGQKPNLLGVVDDSGSRG